MNDLDRAKELRDIIKNLHDDDKQNQIDCIEMQSIIRSGEITDYGEEKQTQKCLGELRLFRKNEYKRLDNLKEQAKQLKEKVEKGCGKSDWVEEYVWLDCDNNYKCQDCQETLKILNEILGGEEE